MRWEGRRPTRTRRLRDIKGQRGVPAVQGLIVVADFGCGGAAAGWRPATVLRWLAVVRPV